MMTHCIGDMCERICENGSWRAYIQAREPAALTAEHRTVVKRYMCFRDEHIHQAGLIEVQVGKIKPNEEAGLRTHHSHLRKFALEELFRELNVALYVGQHLVKPCLTMGVGRFGSYGAYQHRRTEFVDLEPMVEVAS